MKESGPFVGLFVAAPKGVNGMSRKFATSVAMVLAVFLLSGVACGASAKDPATAKEKSADKPKGASGDKGAAQGKVAAVNGVAISQAEFNKALSRFQLQRNSQEPPSAEEMKEIKSRILQSLIDRELLLQESKRVGVKVDDAEVEAQVDSLKKRLGDDAKLGQMLEKWQFTEAQYRETIKNELLMRKLLEQQLGAKSDVTEAEVKAFYNEHPDVFRAPEQVRASHILVKVEANAKEEDKTKAMEKIKAVQQRVKKGEDFAALAKEVSDCPSKEQGGDLNFFSKGMMVAPFENAAFSMDVGAVSDIVESQFGYHLIKVTEKKPAGIRPFEQVKAPVEQHLKAQKAGQLRAQYIEELKAKAKIETFLN